MLADGQPAEKSLTLLRFTQRGNGKQLSHGFRIVTERVQDATADATTEHTVANQYATVCLCGVEKVTDFSTAKDNGNRWDFQGDCSIQATAACSRSLH